MEFDKQYEMAAKMARDAYAKMGWDHEQSPMIFRYRHDGKLEIYLIPYDNKAGVRFKDLVEDLHRELAARSESAMLMMEGWTADVPYVGLRPKDHPARKECLLISMRNGDEVRNGILILDRRAETITPMPLEASKWTGRFS